MTWIELVTGVDLALSPTDTHFSCGFIRKSDNTIHLCKCYPGTHQIECLKTGVKKIINTKFQLKKFINNIQ